MPNYTHIKCQICGVAWNDHIIVDAQGRTVCVGRRPVDLVPSANDEAAVKANQTNQDANPIKESGQVVSLPRIADKDVD